MVDIERQLRPFFQLFFGMVNRTVLLGNWEGSPGLVKVNGKVNSCFLEGFQHGYPSNIERQIIPCICNMMKGEMFLIFWLGYRLSLNVIFLSDLFSIIFSIAEGRLTWKAFQAQHFLHSELVCIMSSIFMVFRFYKFCLLSKRKGQ